MNERRRNDRIRRVDRPAPRWAPRSRHGEAALTSVRREPWLLRLALAEDAAAELGGGLLSGPITTAQRIHSVAIDVAADALAAMEAAR